MHLCLPLTPRSPRALPGFGATTSLPRLSDSCLVFSSRDGERTVCFLSTKLQTQLCTSQTVTPQCTWTAAGAMLQAETDFLSAAKRRKSLETITTSEASLLAEFDEIGNRGTRLVLWGSLEEEHKLTPDDIRLRGDQATWPHEHSLRRYLEILDYCDDEVKPPMQIFISGIAVEPCNWSLLLQHRQEATPYYPHVDAQSNGGERAVARLDLGYKVELQELALELRGKGSPARKSRLFIVPCVWQRPGLLGHKAGPTSIGAPSRPASCGPRPNTFATFIPRKKELSEYSVRLWPLNPAQHPCTPINIERSCGRPCRASFTTIAAD